MSTNPYAPPKANVDDVAVAPVVNEAPPLWNPSAAARWSLLLSPIFGATLHMKNWQAMGETDKAAQSKKWVWGSVGFFVLLMVAGMVLPDTKAIDLLSRGAGLGLLIAWYSLSARDQVRFITRRFGGNYPKRGWGRPLLYALLVFFTFIAVVFGVAFAAGMAADPN
jgi:hypothetical protein